MDDLLLRAALCGAAVALAAGPLGCFVVWRRMAYFGDTLAHGALLGVALGLAAGVQPLWGVAVLTVTLALVLTALQRQSAVSADTLLGIMAHGTLALGLVAIAFLGPVRVDLIGYLFGDILAAGWTEVAAAAVVALVCGAVLLIAWRGLVAATVHGELAAAEAIDPERARLILTLLLALTVAAAMALVGLLLITALLILPAAAARAFARTPETMALGAAAAGVLSVAAGLAAAVWWDLPAGPAIVVAALALCASAHGLGALSGAGAFGRA